MRTIKVIRVSVGCKSEVNLSKCINMEILTWSQHGRLELLDKSQQVVGTGGTHSKRWKSGLMSVEVTAQYGCQVDRHF